MTETTYSARAELADPARFARAARRDLRRSFAVAWPLFRGNLRIRFRRSLLGYLWLLLPALATTAVGVYLKSRNVVDIGRTTLPYGLHVLAGTILWQVFAETLSSPLQQLRAGRQEITRSGVPHEALILAGVYEVLLGAAVRAAVLLVVVVASGVGLGLTVLLVPVGVLGLALLGLAIGLLLTPVGLLYEDVGLGLRIVVGFWFFLTPVVYPAPAHGLLRLNPVTPLLDTTRTWLTSSGPAGGLVLVTGLAAVALVAAWLASRLARPHVVARLG